MISCCCEGEREGRAMGQTRLPSVRMTTRNTANKRRFSPDEDSPLPRKKTERGKGSSVEVRKGSAEQVLRRIQKASKGSSGGDRTSVASRTRSRIEAEPDPLPALNKTPSESSAPTHPRTRSCSLGEELQCTESSTKKAQNRKRAEDFLKQIQRTSNRKGVAGRTRSKSSKQKKNEGTEEGIGGPLTRRKAHVLDGIVLTDKEQLDEGPSEKKKEPVEAATNRTHHRQADSMVLHKQEIEHQTRIESFFSAQEKKASESEQECKVTASCKAQNPARSEANFGARLAKQIPCVIGLLKTHVDECDKGSLGKSEGRSHLTLSVDSNATGRQTRSMRLGGTKKVSQDTLLSHGECSQQNKGGEVATQIVGKDASEEKHSQKNQSSCNTKSEMETSEFDKGIAADRLPDVANTIEEMRTGREFKGFHQRPQKLQPTVNKHWNKTRGEKESLNICRIDKKSSFQHHSGLVNGGIENPETAQQKAFDNRISVREADNLGKPSTESASLAMTEERHHGDGIPKRIFGNIIGKRRMGTAVAFSEDGNAEQNFQKGSGEDVPQTLRRKKGRSICDAGKDLASRGVLSPMNKKDDDGTFWVTMNPRHTGGRQMRPRPLDLNQPLSILVESFDEDHFQDECVSPSNILEQEREEYGKEHVGKLTSAKETGEGLNEHQNRIFIPSFLAAECSDKSWSSSEERYKIPDTYIRYTTPIEGMKKAEYDMDNEDELWLQAHNSLKFASGSLKILHEDQFEAAIDFFENKTAQLQHKCIHGEQGCLIEDHNFKEDFMRRGQKSDQKCCICNGENSMSNLVFKCSCCHIYVHQHCYGIPETKLELRGRYRCKRCAIGLTDANLGCALCLKSGGAFTTSVCRTKWVHVACALYSNETYFVNPDKVELVDGLDEADIRIKKQKRRCCICDAREGSQECCSVKGCYASFHVSCGVKQGAAFEIQESNGQIVQVRPFCPKHASAPPVEVSLEEASFVNKEEQIHANIITGQPTSLRKSNCQNKSKQLVSISVSNDQQLSARAGKIKSRFEVKEKPGKLGSDRVYPSLSTSEHHLMAGKITSRFDLKEKSKRLSYDRVYPSLEEALETDIASTADVQLLYCYWLLKRVKSEGPLLHRLQLKQAAQIYGIFNKDLSLERSEHHPSIQFTSHPRTQDQKICSIQVQLQKLQQLIKLVLQRELLKMQRFLVDREITIMELQTITNQTPICSWCKEAHLILSCSTCRSAFCHQCFKSRKGYGVKKRELASESPAYICSSCQYEEWKCVRSASPPNEDGSCSDPKLEVILHEEDERFVIPVDAVITKYFASSNQGENGPVLSNDSETQGIHDYGNSTDNTDPYPSVLQNQLQGCNGSAPCEGIGKGNLHVSNEQSFRTETVSISEHLTDIVTGSKHIFPHSKIEMLIP